MFIETTAKLDRAFQKQCPQLYRNILGKRYILPQYRISHYESQDALNQPMYDWFADVLRGRINFTDDLTGMRLVNYAMALRYDRPTLYCERELGEALQRTDLPSDLTVADLNFKWPQLRIIPEKQAAILKRNGVDLRLVSSRGHATAILTNLFVWLEHEPASEKQKRYCRFLGHPEPWQLTKREANRWIAQHKLTKAVKL